MVGTLSFVYIPYLHVHITLSFIKGYIYDSFHAEAYSFHKLYSHNFITKRGLEYIVKKNGALNLHKRM